MEKFREALEWLILGYEWKQWYLNFNVIADFFKSKICSNKNINYYDRTIYYFSNVKHFLHLFFSFEIYKLTVPIFIASNFAIFVPFHNFAKISYTHVC